MLLPVPECEYGFTTAQVEEILDDEDRLEQFGHWMEGQTMALCSGHGAVVYHHDLQRFLDGLPPVE